MTVVTLKCLLYYKLLYISGRAIKRICIKTLPNFHIKYDWKSSPIYGSQLKLACVAMTKVSDRC